MSKALFLAVLLGIQMDGVAKSSEGISSQDSSLIGRKEDRGWECCLGLDLGKRTAKPGAASCVIATEAIRKRFQGRCLHG